MEIGPTASMGMSSTGSRSAVVVMVEELGLMVFFSSVRGRCWEVELSLLDVIVRSTAMVMVE